MSLRNRAATWSVVSKQERLLRTFERLLGQTTCRTRTPCLQNGGHFLLSLATQTNRWLKTRHPKSHRRKRRSSSVYGIVVQAQAAHLHSNPQRRRQYSRAICTMKLPYARTHTHPEMSPPHVCTSRMDTTRCRRHTSEMQLSPLSPSRGLNLNHMSYSKHCNSRQGRITKMVHTRFSEYA